MAAILRLDPLTAGLASTEASGDDASPQTLAIPTAQLSAGAAVQAAAAAGDAPALDALGAMPRGRAAVGAGAPVATGAPELPDVQGPRATAAEAAGVVLSTTAFDAAGSADGRPISTAAMFQILQDAANEGFELESILHRSANKNVQAAKQLEIAHLNDQIAAEKHHAGAALGISIASAATTMASAGFGAKLKTPIADVDGAAGGATSAARAGAGAAPGDAKAPGSAASTAAKVEATAQKAASSAAAAAPGAPVRSAAQQAQQTRRAAEQAQTQRAAAEDAAGQGAGDAATARAATARARADAQAASAQAQPAAGAQAATPAPAAAGARATVGQAPDAGATAAQAAQAAPAEVARGGVLRGNNRMMYGSMLETSGMALGGVVQSTGDLVEKMVGGQHDADVARVAQKLDALRAQIMQSVVDATKSGLDSALENLKAAQSSVQSFVQRWTEVSNNIASR